MPGRWQWANQDLMRFCWRGADLLAGRLLLRYFFTGAVYRGTRCGTVAVHFLFLLKQLWKSHSLSHAMNKCPALFHLNTLSQVPRRQVVPTSGKDRPCLQAKGSFFLKYFLSLRDPEPSQEQEQELVRELLGRSIDIWNMNIWSGVAADTIDREKAFGLFIEGSFLFPGKTQELEQCQSAFGCHCLGKSYSKDSGSPLM